MSRGTGKPRMNLSLDCIPCFVRHALEAARFATSDPAIHEQVLREVLSEAATWDLRQPAPVLSQHVHRRLRTPGSRLAPKHSYTTVGVPERAADLQKAGVGRSPVSGRRRCRRSPGSHPDTAV
jgi:hypothetical protein